MSTENKVKLYGFGAVGQGFHSYLVDNGEEERLHTVIVKDDTKKRKPIKAILETTNPNTAQDKTMYAIIELISSAEEAFGIVYENLEIGKNVVSANKKLIAYHLAELIEAEKNNNGRFLYEGAVCGSIPIIRILNDLFGNDPVRKVSGIFNGSSNYILSKLFNDNISYQEALKQAQDLGFAEADPTSDVGGYDALYKLIIVAAHAFGKIVHPDDVLNIGIQNISLSDIEFAKKHHQKIKLIAKSSIEGNKLILSVLPTFVNSDNDLYGVENEYNAVLVESDNIGQHFYKGKGAGSLPTGSVVYSDLKAIDAGYSYSYNKLNKAAIQLANEEEIHAVLSAETSANIQNVGIDISNFTPIDISGKQLLGKISLADLKKNKIAIEQENVSVIVIEDERLIKELINTSVREEVKS